MKTWKPCYQNMCSMFQTPEEVQEQHKKHLAYYGAEESDCELVNLEAAPAWDKAKTHYRLNIYTYLGWKVYMLHTGCFATKPEYERDQV